MKNKLLSVITAAAVLSLSLSTAAVILCTKAYIGAASAKHTAIDETTANTDFDSGDISDDSDAASEANGTNGANANGICGVANAFSFSDDNAILLFYDAESGRLIASDPLGNEIYSATFETDILTDDEAECLRRGIILEDTSALASAIEDLTS